MIPPEQGGDEDAESALRDDQPSPWVACPQCGDVWFKITAVLERGRWIDDGTGKHSYEIDLEDHPFVGGYHSGKNDIECISCHHKFGMEDVGYGRIDEEIEETKDEDDG